MMKYFLLFTVFISQFTNAQTISFSDAAFKSKLLQSSDNNSIARNLADDSFAIDGNNNGEIEIAEALKVSYLDIESSSTNSLIDINNFTNLISLQCSNNSISTLNINSLKKLTDLNCNNNNLNTLILNETSQLQKLNCQSNQLVTLDVGNLTNLITIDCSDNKLTQVNLKSLTNLQSFVCNSNQIVSLNLDDLINLITLECTTNALTSLNFSKLDNIEHLNCSFNKLASLDVSTLTGLTNFDCSNNQLLTIKVNGLSRLSDLNCEYNLLTILNINTLPAIVFLNCSNNNLQSITVTGLINLKVLNISKNKLSALDIYGLNNLKNLSCSNNKLVELDATNQTRFESLDISNNVLTNLYIKNGSNESFGFLIISGNPNLNYICADESEVEYVQEQITFNGYSNCTVSSYCTFVPGGTFFLIEGNNKLDSNNDGCDAQDRNFPNLKLTTNDGTNTSTFIAGTTGFYSYGVPEGNYTLTPVLENPNYHSVSPAKSSLSFPSQISPFLTNFCIRPNGNHGDLEISILPLNDSKSNSESNYIILYHNKGTVSSSGAINFTFDADALNVIIANPQSSSQSLGILNWNFTNLKPQETRTILVTLKVKPSINSGYSLKYKTTIATSTDENPDDNSFDLSQSVVSSLNSNDKICLEGTSIPPAKVGDYLHYMIRFENSGSSIANNIVIKDLIDVSKFDIETLVPSIGSHPFTTKITNNSTVEFTFQNINLPYITNNNKGYVAFKIKTVPGLVAGNEVTNTANIYFDYKQPLTTNTTETSIKVLQVQDFILSDSIILYPNPVKNTLNIKQKNELGIGSIAIFNSVGQLMQTIIGQDLDEMTTIDVSQLKKGLYFLKVNADNGSLTSKFLKD